MTTLQFNNYVKQRETDLKAQLKAEIAWNQFLNLWYLVGDTISMERDIALLTEEYKKRRSEYVKRGRKASISPAKAA